MLACGPYKCIHQSKLETPALQPGAQGTHPVFYLGRQQHEPRFVGLVKHTHHTPHKATGVRMCRSLSAMAQSSPCVMHSRRGQAGPAAGPDAMQVLELCRYVE